MIYFKLAQKLCSGHKVFQTMMVALLTAICFMVLFGTSIVKYRYRFYEPFEDDLNGKGYSCGVQCLNFGIGNGGRLVKSREDIKKNLNKVKDAYATYQLSPMYYGYRRVSAWSYDDALIRKYTPALKEGNWLDCVNADEDELCAVIYNQDGSIHAGDTMTLSEDNYGYSLNVKIIGVLDEDALVYGFHSNYTQDGANNGTVQDFYVSPQEIAATGIYAMDIENNSLNDEDIAVPNVLFFANENLNQNKLFSAEAGGDGTGIQRVACGMVHIMYEDDITDSELQENEDALRDSTYLQKISLEERKENSQNYIYAQLNVLLPLGICAAVLLVIALLSYEVLNFSSQLRSYAILFINGMKWRNSILICVWHNLMVQLLSVGVFFLGFFAIKRFHIVGMEYCNINAIFILLMVFIMALDMVLSIVLPMFILNHRQPKSLLYNH
jgi:hypothetical protein